MSFGWLVNAIQVGRSKLPFLTLSFSILFVAFIILASRRSTS